MGTIFNKQTQLLAYADDIDIVGRGLEAVRDANLALEAKVAEDQRAKDKIHDCGWKYNDYRRRINCGYWRKEFQCRQCICVLGRSYDTEERRG
jgi:hypothetical protein